jgi:hypothetical protein
MVLIISEVLEEELFAITAPLCKKVTEILDEV